MCICGMIRTGMVPGTWLALYMCLLLLLLIIMLLLLKYWVKQEDLRSRGGSEFHLDVWSLSMECAGGEIHCVVGHTCLKLRRQD